MLKRSFINTTIRKKPFLVLFIGLSSLVADAQFQSNFFNDTTGRASAEFQSSYVAGSNVMDIDYANTFLYGGTIDRQMKDRAYDRLKSNNRLGLDIAMRLDLELPVDSLFGKENLSLLVGLRYYDHIDASFGEDVFRLAFDGNKQFAGQTIDIANTNYNQYRFQYLSFGILKTKKSEQGWAKEGVVVNLIKGQEHHVITTPRAELYTEELGRELTLDMNYIYNRTDTGTTGLGAFNGIGIGTDLFTEFFVKNGAKVRLEVNDLGFVYWNNSSIEMRTDSMYTFDGIYVNNIFDLNDTVVNQISKDSIINSVTMVNKKEHYSIALPTSINASYTKALSDRSVFNGGVYYKILSNYFPYAYTNWYYYFNPTMSAKIHLAYGGYGKLNAGIAFAKSFNFIDVIVGTNNIEGFILPNNAFANSGFVRLKKYF